MVIGRKRITARGMLFLLGDLGDALLPLTRKQAYCNFYRPKMIDWEDYFPSIVNKIAVRLERKGEVELKETPEGMRVIITEKGKRKILEFRLRDLAVKTGKWDGVWRLVFFDVAEVERGKRDSLRKYLKQIGLKQMQESVWVSPWDIRDKVMYLREVLEIPHSVKIGLMSEIENEEDLKGWFELK